MPVLLLLGAIRGLFASSTRVELAGAIVSLLRQEPIHLASDNAAVVDKGMKLLNANGPGRRPWALQKDGDLWHQMFQIIKDRGAHSVAFSWTKGHATLRHVLDEKVDTRDAIYNSLADRAADHGHRLHNVELQNQMFSYFAKKQQCLIKIVTAIAKRIARVATAATIKLEAIDKARRSKGTVYIDVPPMPTYKSLSCGIHLLFEALPPLPVDRNAALHSAQVRTFWSRIVVEPIDDTSTQIGATWLELFIFLACEEATLFRARVRAESTYASRMLSDTNICSIDPGNCLNSLAHLANLFSNRLLVGAILTRSLLLIMVLLLACLCCHSDLS